MQSGSLLPRLITACLVGLILSSCGGGDDPDPTNTVAANNDPTTSATLDANEVTAGQIADRIAAAWTNVASYRSTTRILPASGTPVAMPGGELAGSAERHVILPDQKRIVITDQGATTEIVLSGGMLSKRTIPPGEQPGPWETIDSTQVGANDPFARTYETILAPEAPPYSGLGNRQRERIGTDQGMVSINGRDCTSYLFPEVTETGERIQIIVSLDSSDLPCRIETRAGLTTSQTDYTFNQESAIATPIAAATPEASPITS